MTGRTIFIARFPGWCPACHGKIEVGETVCFDGDKNVIHAQCAEDDE